MGSAGGHRGRRATRLFDAIPAAFAAGKIGDGRGRVLSRSSYAQAVNKKFRWAYAAVPKGPKGRTAYSATTDSYRHLERQRRTRMAAWELVKYLSAASEFHALPHPDYRLLSERAPPRLRTGKRHLTVAKYPRACRREPRCGSAQAMQSGLPRRAQPLFKKDAEYRATSSRTCAPERCSSAGGTPTFRTSRTSRTQGHREDEAAEKFPESLRVSFSPLS